MDVMTGAATVTVAAMNQEVPATSSPRKPGSSRAFRRIRMWMLVVVAVFAAKWWWQNRG